ERSGISPLFINIAQIFPFEKGRAGEIHKLFRARSDPTKEEPIRQKLLFTRDAGRVYDNPGSFPISHPLGPRSVKPLGGPFLSGGHEKGARHCRAPWCYLRR
ncbi:hypothetical protein HHFLNI_HHFLNI_05925, partial [Dysosmobacter welbionis]